MTKNIKRWCFEMDLTPKETRFIINYLRHVYDDKSIGSHSTVDEEDLIEALDELKLTDEYNATCYDQYGIDVDEYVEYFESVMAGASGISDAAPENIVNLEEGKKKCKGKDCKDSDDCCNDDLVDVGLDDYGGRRYGGKIDSLVNEFLEKEFKK